MKPPRRLATCTLAAALAIGGGPGLHSQSSVSYTLTDLGTLSRPLSEAWDINDSGQVTGMVQTTDHPVGQGVFHHRAFLWQDGVLTDLGTLGTSPVNGSTNSSATAINGAGQVVGSATTVHAGLHAFLWENGVMTDLGTLGGATSAAEGINALGQVVGTAQTSHGVFQGFLWQNGVMTELATGGAGGIRPFDINTSGVVVGVGGTAGHAVLWQQGVLSDLGTLGGPYSAALAINDTGQAVGFAFTSAGVSNAALWQDSTTIDLGAFNGMYTLAYDINGSGHIVGSASVEGEGWNASALLWQDGVMIDLNTLLPPDSGWKLEFAKAINDCGQIVGEGLVDGTRRMFLLTPSDAAERCPGPPNPSADGTEVPPASRVIDATGAVWTLGLDGETLRNGVHAAVGGYARSLLWTGNMLYAYGRDDQWWQWNGSWWVVYGGRPGVSADGTEVPPSSRVIDATGSVWTLGIGGETLRNGVHAAGGYARSLLWTGNMLYAYAWDDQWWQWNGTWWVVYGARPGAGGSPLPAGWTATDIGAVGVAGRTTFDGLTFNVAGAGADVWDTTDAFQFAYMRVAGDIDVRVRVTDLTGPHEWSKAGLMIRESLDPDARHHFLLASEQNGLALQWRAAAGDASAHTALGASPSHAWLRITRAGSTIHFYHSTDGTHWTLASASQFTSGEVLVGLAVTSHDATRSATATFDSLHAFTSPLPGNEEAFEVTGVVTNDRDVPVANVEVGLIATHQLARTDASGGYTIGFTATRGAWVLLQIADERYEWHSREFRLTSSHFVENVR